MRNPCTYFKTVLLNFQLILSVFQYKDVICQTEDEDGKGVTFTDTATGDLDINVSTIEAS